jgi:hypothetical protein
MEIRWVAAKTPHTGSMEVCKKRPRGFKKRPGGVKKRPRGFKRAP